MDVDKLFMAPPVFETERLILRKLDLSDAADYFKFANDPIVSAETLWDGRTGLISIDLVHERTEIGYALSREYWGKGIATEAVKEIIRYSFLEVGFNRIEGRCNYNNPGSYRVMEKLGMKYEGILRQQLKIKGAFVDQRIYSILKNEYEG